MASLSLRTQKIDIFNLDIISEGFLLETLERVLLVFSFRTLSSHRWIFDTERPHFTFYFPHHKDLIHLSVALFYVAHFWLQLLSLGEP